jgi:AcrR family transcriptional regulator
MNQDALRPRILKIAIRCFSKKGYHRTSVDEIADIVGVTDATVLDIFHSRSGLFMAAVEAVDSQRLFDKPVLKILAQEPDFEKAIRTVMSIGYSKVMDKTYTRLRLFGYLERPDLMRAFFERATLPYYVAICNRLRREAVAGKVRRDLDYESAAAAVLFMVCYRRILEQLGPAFPDLKITRRDMDHFADVWLRGVLVQNAEMKGVENFHSFAGVDKSQEPVETAVVPPQENLD